jgi:hypothetical protein
VFVSGAQSKMLPKYGCYQSSVVDSGLYFPSGPTELQPPSSLRGTLATLRVDNGLGDVPDCAGAGAETTKDAIKFSRKVAKLPIKCGQLSERCAGKAAIRARGGRCSYCHKIATGQPRWTKGGRCSHCGKIATGHYSVAPHSKGTIRLTLTKAGINLLRHGPRCSKCKLRQKRAAVTVPAHLVITSATGTTSNSPIQVRRPGRCVYCR